MSFACSFCHKKLSEISLLIVDHPEKKGKRASICNECIGICCEIMFESILKAKPFFDKFGLQISPESPRK